MIVVLAALISARLMFPGGQGVEQFGVAFCNAGFIGIPLVSQLLGEGCLFYLTIYLTVMPLFVWTVGLTLITGDAAGIRWRKNFWQSGDDRLSDRVRFIPASGADSLSAGTDAVVFKRHATRRWG